MSNLVDRFVQAQAPPSGAQPAGQVPKISIALVPYGIVFGALAWVGSHFAEEIWAYFTKPARKNPRRGRRQVRRAARWSDSDGADGDEADGGE